jgi:hypothetical protein
MPNWQPTCAHDEVSTPSRVDSRSTETSVRQGLFKYTMNVKRVVHKKSQIFHTLRTSREQ